MRIARKIMEYTAFTLWWLIVLFAPLLAWSAGQTSSEHTSWQSTGQPSWLAHADLMGLLIVALIAIVGILLGVIFEGGKNVLLGKMNEMCTSIKGKADSEDLKAATAEHSEMWHRINHHGHVINCNQDGCKPECGKVVISGGPS
jgi:hypothetical protein